MTMQNLFDKRLLGLVTALAALLVTPSFSAGAPATLALGQAARADGGKKLEVVTTLPDYGFVARYLGGDLVRVRSIVAGDQDAHFVRPKPSFAAWLSRADVFVTTGMDLELWAPSLVDKSGNAKIRQGQPGYVAAADGVKKLEIPVSKDRSQGGVHIYGNPHIHVSPVNLKQIAENIAIGLIKNDPAHRDHYEARLKAFKAEIDRRLYGPKLVRLLGSGTLTRLALSGNLVSFLEKKSYKGQPMVDLLGGWLGEGRAFRGKRLVTYHKNWIYFTKLFGLRVLGEVEPKPAIPPSPHDVEKLIQLMRDQKVRVVLAANYFDEQRVRKITRAVGGIPVIVPLSTGGSPQAKTYFDLVDLWVSSLEDAFAQADGQ